MWICLCGRQQKKSFTYVYLCLGEVLTAANWMLSIEGQVVVPPHPNFVAGIEALFASYYIFNLVYQEEAPHTSV